MPGDCRAEVVRAPVVVDVRAGIEVWTDALCSAGRMIISPPDARR
jgi:hypothetical protein